jgi:hypothetical protein
VVSTPATNRAIRTAMVREDRFMCQLAMSNHQAIP